MNKNKRRQGREEKKQTIENEDKQEKNNRWNYKEKNKGIKKQNKK